MAAGQSTIQVTIIAVDKATKALVQIQKQLSKTFAPARQLGRSFQQFSRVSGLSAVARGLGRVGVAAYGVANQVARAVQSMALLTGVGTLSGVVALSVAWGKLGFEVSKTANVLGASTDDLLRFRSAAEQFGISGDTATAALKAMGDTLEDATYGRNQAALVMMKQLGFEMHRTAGGAIDTHRAMMDLARLFQDPRWNGNRQAMGLAARMFGAESMMPLLLQGPNAINSMERESQLTGAAPNAEATERANAFGAVLYRAKSAAEGLGNTIGDKLIPVLQPLLEKFISWEIANKDVIGTQIANFVDGLIKGISELIPKVNSLADSFGGWKNVAIGLGIVMTLNVLAPTILLGKELISLTGTILTKAIPAIMALGNAWGSAGAFGTAGTFATGAARLGLLGLSLGAGAWAGDALSDWYTRQRGTSFGSDLYDADNPNADKAPTDFAARFRHPVTYNSEPLAPQSYTSNLRPGLSNAQLTEQLRSGQIDSQQLDAYVKARESGPVKIHVTLQPGMEIRQKHDATVWTYDGMNAR